MSHEEETDWRFRAVGVIRSPYREKFGIPRQPGLVPEARMTLEFLPPFDVPEAVAGLEAFSHVWVLFVFHGVPAGRWRPTVRPPRLGGNRRVGVFASRSTFRPNPIGLSLLALEAVETADGVRLDLCGGDLLDGTPVLDVKPYLPWAEALPEARGGFAEAAPPRLPVRFSARAEAALARHGEALARHRALIEAMLSCDPRPAYHRGEAAERVYGVRVAGFDVRFRAEGDTLCVLDILPEDETT